MAGCVAVYSGSLWLAASCVAAAKHCAGQVAENACGRRGLAVSMYLSLSAIERKCMWRGQWCGQCVAHAISRNIVTNIENENVIGVSICVIEEMKYVSQYEMASAERKAEASYTVMS